MKIGIFTDPHYSSRELSCKKRYNSRSLRKIREAMEDFSAKGCELVLCLGDVIDTEPDHEREIENLRAVGRVLDEYDLKCYCLMGNHDGFRFTVEEFYRVLGESHRPADGHFDGISLIFLDACYHRDGEHYRPGRSDWKDVAYPHADLLRQTVAAAEGEIYLFLHQNLDPAAESNHRLANDGEIRGILEQCGRVKGVFQGHFHPGCESFCNGIYYKTLPAMCENEGCWFVFDL